MGFNINNNNKNNFPYVPLANQCNASRVCHNTDMGFPWVNSLYLFIVYSIYKLKVCVFPEEIKKEINISHIRYKFMMIHDVEKKIDTDN